jgi:hypothetical protein
MLEASILKNSDYNFIFISRHDLNKGQIALVKEMGFKTTQKISHTFTDTLNPQEFNGLVSGKSQAVGLVGPTHLFINILKSGGIDGPLLIEFVNQPSARKRGRFLCKGAVMYWVDENGIQSKFVPCPLSINEQDEGDLNYGGVK